MRKLIALVVIFALLFGGVGLSVALDATEGYFTPARGTELAGLVDSVSAESGATPEPDAVVEEPLGDAEISGDSEIQDAGAPEQAPEAEAVGESSTGDAVDDSEAAVAGENPTADAEVSEVSTVAEDATVAEVDSSVLQMAEATQVGVGPSLPLVAESPEGVVDPAVLEVVVTDGLQGSFSLNENVAEIYNPCPKPQPTQPTTAPQASPTPETKPSATPEPKSSPTPAPKPTDTPEPTATEEATGTSEPTETPEPTATDTQVPTATNTVAPTLTNTPIPTETQRATATATQITIATNTPVIPTETPLPTATKTSVVMESESEAAVPAPLSCLFVDFIATGSHGGEQDLFAVRKDTYRDLTVGLNGNASQFDFHPLGCVGMHSVMVEGSSERDIVQMSMRADGEPVFAWVVYEGDNFSVQYLSSTEIAYLSIRGGKTYLMKRDLVSGKEFTLAEAPNALDFAGEPGQDVVAWTNGSQVTFLSLSSKKSEVQSLVGSSIRWTPDGNLIADGRRGITEVSPRSRIMFTASNGVSDLAIADAAHLAGIDGNGQVWELKGDYTPVEQWTNPDWDVEFSQPDWWTPLSSNSFKESSNLRSLSK